MKSRHRSTRLLAAVALATVVDTADPTAAPTQPAPEPLRVVATVSDLGSLAAEVGGPHVAVTTLTKGTEDPHFTEAKPSFIKALAGADLYIQNGLELEIGWAPVLLTSARNAKVLPGAAGYLDASAAIVPLGVPATVVDRSMGHVHSRGNPHYLLDPVNGLAVAQSIRDALARLRPSARADFESRFAGFERRLGSAMVGEPLATKYDVRKLAKLYEHDALGRFLDEQGERGLLSGWLGDLMPHQGTSVVADHNLWPYFARRFGISVVAYLEPKPGISPTTAHLKSLIARMKSEGIRLVLAAPYYDPRFARFVSEHTGATIVEAAHQVGSREQANDYFSMIAYNVDQLVRALRETE